MLRWQFNEYVKISSTNLPYKTYLMYEYIRSHLEYGAVVCRPSNHEPIHKQFILHELKKTSMA